ncbi:MAG: hypothetical protein KDI33_21330 [Halioglobus sp.]|nr:hypothetical protein [Halioglobus sp.]
MRPVGTGQPATREEARQSIRCIAILSATASELRPVQRSLGIAGKPREGENYCAGSYKGVTVITAITDAGLAAAERATEALFARFGDTIDHVFVVGRAGAYDLRLKIGEVVIPEAVVDQRDGIARTPVNLSARAPSGVIYSSDKHGFDDEYIDDLNNNSVSVVDMESGAIATVCHRYGCPLTVVRAVSDQVDLLAESRDVYQLAGLSDYGSALRFALQRPRRIAYLVTTLLGVKKAISASSRELLRNIESLLQQACSTEKPVKVDVRGNARTEASLLARTGES